MYVKLNTTFIKEHNIILLLNIIYLKFAKKDKVYLSPKNILNNLFFFNLNVNRMVHSKPFFSSLSFLHHVDIDMTIISLYLHPSQT